MTLSQIRRRWFLDHVDFTSLEKVEELLEDINEEYDWNLFDLMGNLIAGRYDSFSIEKERPYIRVFVHRSRRHLYIKIKRDGEQMEFTVPLNIFPM